MRKLMFLAGVVLAMAVDSMSAATGAGITVDTPAAVTLRGTLQEPAITTTPQR